MTINAMGVAGMRHTSVMDAGLWMLNNNSGLRKTVMGVMDHLYCNVCMRPRVTNLTVNKASKSKSTRPEMIPDTPTTSNNFNTLCVVFFDAAMTDHCRIPATLFIYSLMN